MDPREPEEVKRAQPGGAVRGGVGDRGTTASDGAAGTKAATGRGG